MSDSDAKGVGGAGEAEGAAGAIDEARLGEAFSRLTDGELDREAFGERLADAAAGEGLLDVAYSSVSSPFGELLAAGSTRGLVMLSYPDYSPDAALERLSREISPRLLEAPARLDPVRAQLEEYFNGDRRSFDLSIDWRLTRGFVREVLRGTAGIPFGETRTYAEMAAGAGSPRAFRAAGSALGANPIPIVVPCHRVLRSGGALGGYAGGLEVKRELLQLEGAFD